MSDDRKKLTGEMIDICLQYVFELENALDQIAIIIEEEEGFKALDKFNEIFNHTNEVYGRLRRLKKEEGIK